MKLLYVAGPYRSDTLNGIAENIAKARQVALEIWQAGGYALCPHMNTALMDGAVTVEHILEGDFEMLRRCDGIVMLPGWEQSEGAKMERKEAVKACVPVYVWTDKGDALEILKDLMGKDNLDTLRDSDTL